MFFLLRMAFWLGLVLILLPSGSSQRAARQTRSTHREAISAASATVGDLRQFCTRQPDACTVGSHVATELGYKAQAGAKMLYDFLTEALASKEAGSVEASGQGIPRTCQGNRRRSQAARTKLRKIRLPPPISFPPGAVRRQRKNVKHSA